MKLLYKINFNVFFLILILNSAFYSVQGQEILGQVTQNSIGTHPFEGVSYNGAFYFSAYNPETGRELFKYDGTTTTVIDVIPGVEGSEPTGLLVMNNVLYFYSPRGYKLYSYDGTLTQLTTGMSYIEGRLKEFNGAIYFSGSTIETGQELFTFDGTDVQVIDINPGQVGSSPQNLIVSNNILYFGAYVEGYGVEPVKFDGINFTPIDVNPGIDSSYPYSLTDVNGSLYFGAYANATNVEPYKYDGSTLTLIGNIMPSEGSYPNGFIEYNGKVYFSAYPDFNTIGEELYSYDGTTLELFNLDTNSGYSSSPRKLKVFNGYLYFSATLSSVGNELVRFDGTNYETIDIVTGSNGSYPEAYAELNGNLFVITGQGLYEINGLEATKFDYPDVITYHDKLGSLDNELILSATTENEGTKLWTFNNGVFTKHELNNATLGFKFAKWIGDVLYFVPQYSFSIYQYDGETVSQVYTGSSEIDELIEYNNQLYFITYTNELGKEIFKYDGISVSPIDIREGTESSNPENIVELNGNLYFVASSAATGLELWKYDGSSPTVFDLNPGTGHSYPYELTVYNNKLYFNAYIGGVDSELYSFDGTNFDSYDINGTGGSFPNSFKATSSGLYFAANDGTNGQELWRYEEGSGFTLIEIESGAAGVDIKDITEIGGEIFFQAYGSNGHGLWKYKNGDLITIYNENFNVNASFDFLASTNDVLFFQQETESGGRALYRLSVNGALTILDNDAYQFSYRVYPGINKIYVEKSYNYSYSNGNIGVLNNNQINYIDNLTLVSDADYSVSLYNDALYFISEGYLKRIRVDQQVIINLNDKSFTSAPFDIPYTPGASGNPVTFNVESGPATIVDGKLLLTGTGSVTLSAFQPGNLEFKDANTVLTFIVLQASQQISIETPQNKTYGDEDFSITATASSQLPVTLELISGPATLTNGVVTITGAGTVTVKASQSGNENYLPAADVTISFEVAKKAQAITFAEVGAKTFGDADFALDATSDSGLPVTFEVVSGPATLIDQMVSITGAGEVVIKASQAGTENYLAAPDATISITVSKKAQAITFAEVGAKTFGDADFALDATSDSGLPVTFEVVSGPATLLNQNVGITGAGEVVIKASQIGNENYLAAPDATITITVAKKAQAITFAEVGAKTFGDADFALDATADSGLPVTFEIVSGPATLVDQTVSITGAGVVTVKAIQAGDNNYLATETEQVITVDKAAQVVTFEALNDVYEGGENVILNATSTSGLPITYNVTGKATLLADGKTLAFDKGTGTVTVEAVQAGNENYFAAESVTHSFNVIVDPVLSAEQSKEKTIQVWPVPANEMLNIAVNGKRLLTVTVMTIQGQVLYRSNTSGNECIVNVNNFVDGVYMLLVTTEEGLTTSRQIRIQH